MPTIRRSLDQFLLHCRYEKNLTAKTIKAYAGDLRQFETFLSKSPAPVPQDVTDVGREYIREYLRLLFSRYKDRTIKRKVATLKVFFSHLEFEDIIEASPFRKLRLKIDREKTLPPVMTLDSVQRILRTAYAAAHGRDNAAAHVARRDLAILELLFASGMRVGELCALKREDVNLSEGKVKVYGKGRKERVIPICDPEVKQALASYARFWRIGDALRGPFFLSARGDRLSEQTVRALTRKYAAEAGVPHRVTPHMFRHTVATLLLENGVDIRNIQYLLGHSSITVTEKYVRVHNEAQRRILEERHPRRGLGVENY